MVCTIGVVTLAVYKQVAPRTLCGCASIEVIPPFSSNEVD